MRASRLISRLCRLVILAPALWALGGLLTAAPDGSTPRSERLRKEEAVAVGNPSSLDATYPEAFRVATWIDMDLPSSRVLLTNLRILTANRNWTLRVCESPQDPSSCLNLIGGQGPSTPGWQGDYRDKLFSLIYQDRLGQQKLHLQVTPVRGDWMIFRIQVQAQPIL